VDSRNEKEGRFRMSIFYPPQPSLKTGREQFLQNEEVRLYLKKIILASPPPDFRGRQRG